MDIRREHGMALLIAMMLMLLFTAFGIALILTTSSETMISSNFRDGGEGLYAADAAVERAMDDLLTVPDWNVLLSANTSVRSAFVDGPPSGVRTLSDGSKLDLGQAVSMANCGLAQVAPCTDMQMDDASVPGRPWGPNNPRWQLYAYGKLSDMLPTGTINSPYYVMVFVGDDPSENDADPTIDGGAPAAYLQPTPPSNPGRGLLALRAEAFGPRGAHKVIEITVERTDTTELERGYTGQRGQDEQNRRTRKAAVQLPGKALQMQTLSLGGGGIS